MPRKTRAHDRCQPFVVRYADRIELHAPVIRPNGEPSVLVYEIDAQGAALIASDLMAGVMWTLQTKATKDAVNRATNT